MTTLMEAVATATATVPRLYATNSVPAAPEYPYGSYWASLGRGDTYLLDVSEGVRWGRVVVQTFGKTFDSAIARAEEVRAALVGIRVTVTGYPASTPLVVELDPAASRDPDDNGVVGVTTTYTFTVTKEQP